MTQREREAEVRRRLYGYAKYKKELAEYVDDIFNGTKPHDESGVRGTGISDPSARGGIALADLPRHLADKQKWIYAIDSAIKELRDMDAGDSRGLVYICTHLYGLDGRRHKRRDNRDTAVKVADDCFMSVRSLYYRVRIILNVVLYHAAKNGCFGEQD